VAAIPLAISRVAGVRVAKLLGDPLSQYSDTLAQDGAAYPSLKRFEAGLALVSEADVFLFRRVREDAKLLQVIGEIGGEKIASSSAPFADLTEHGNFDSFLKAHWKAHRNRNRLRRRAENDGALEFEIAFGSSRRASELTA